MPEIKNTFISGKMNKDLDERLVPSGEYRDALNVDIATSESSNTGVVENSFGNTVVSALAPSGSRCVGVVNYAREDRIYWLVAGPVPSTGEQGLDLIIEYHTDGDTTTPRAVFVDVYQDKATVSSHSGGANTITLSAGNDNIRAGMTVSGTNVPANTTVASISGTTLTLSGAGSDYSSVISGTLTFVADKVLNFVQGTDDLTSKHYISGINVLDGFLMWTDNKTEPKKIHIKRCKNGTPSNILHTKLIVNGIDKGHIKEEHITTIKKYPLNAPKIVMSSSESGGTITSTCTTAANFFTYLDGVGGNTVPVPSGTNVDSNVEDPDGNIYYDYSTGSAVAVKLPSAIQFSPQPAWTVGQTIKMTAETSVNDIDEEIEIRLVLEELTNFSATMREFKCSVASISSNTTSSELTWTCDLEQKDPFYELKFPRFAYRWKYKDGEYSVISPWTRPAFLPDVSGGFDYDADNGYNLAMTNNVRKLTIDSFETKPDDVIEVDVLYKDSVSTNMYVVETLKDNETELEITNEQVHSLIPSNQSLRPWDNVPRKALAQEVSANRLMYANYLQNYNVAEDPEFVITHNTTEILDAGTPTRSLKSIRNYQVGIVYLDKYGRQTPVLSNDAATVTIPQKDAKKRNSIRAKVTTDAPSWATHFKYYIKEPSDQYYNLAMDRWYDAEDGNVWISFPSSERNKITIDDYLILKKKHDSHEAVELEGSAKYKILSIENEAPDFLKMQKSSLGVVETSFGRGQDWTDGVPQQDYTTVIVKGAAMVGSSLENIAGETVGNKYFRIKTSSGSVSDWYAVGTVSRTDINGNEEYNDTNDYYTITSKKPFKSDIDFVVTGNMASGNETQGKAAGLQFEWAVEETVSSPEFGGRFFVKINRDSLLQEYLLSNDANAEYMIQHSVKLYYFTSNTDERDDFQGHQIFGIDEGAFGRHARPQNGHGSAAGVGLVQGSKYLDIRLIEIDPDNKKNPEWYFPGQSRFKNTSKGGTAATNFAVHNALRASGTILRFKDDPDQEVYKIKSVLRVHLNNYNRGVGYNNSYHGNAFKDSSNHAIRYEMTLDKYLNWNPTKAGEFGGVTPSSADSTDKDGNNQYPLTWWAKPGRKRNSFTELQILKQINTGVSYSSDNPAIFETEPKERPDLNLYYETAKTHDISTLGSFHTIEWHNCFSFGNGVESNRIRDDFNAPTIDKGPRVSTELAEQYKEDHKFSGLIYSGIYNSQSGVNETNQFIQAEQITKDLNPAYGSIQKLFTRQTNVLAFCEDKVAKILTNKDALYNADGSHQLTATNKVLAQTIIPDTFGKYGIGTNPESFAVYGYRIYFTDRNRNTVCRLSGDGIEEISRYGMTDYFKDAFNNIDSKDIILGTYDEDKGNYNLTINNETISFTELVRGWTSRKSFIPEDGISLNGKYYTFKDGEMWEHNKNATRCSFYGETNQGSSIKLIFNEGPSQIKNFKTLNYEGTQSKIIEHDGHDSDGGVGIGAQYYNEDPKDGWYCDSIVTDQQSGSVNEFVEKEGKWYNYIKGEVMPTDTTIDIQEFSSQGIGEIKEVGGTTTVTGYDITVSVNDSGSNNYTTSAPQIIENKGNGASINQAVTFSLSANGGYEFTDTSVAAMTAASETSSPVTNCVVEGNVTFTKVDANNVTVSVPVIFTMGAANQSIVVNLTGGAVVPGQSIEGTNKVSIPGNMTHTTSPADQATNYSKTNVPTTTGVTLFTKQFVAAANYKIGTDPDTIVDLSACDTPSNYDVSYVQNTGTFAGENLTDVTFTVKYKFPTEDISGDVIDWRVENAENLAVSTGKIHNYTFSETSINYFGEVRKLKIFGDPDATLTLNAYNNATSGTSLVSGPKTVTIPSNGIYEEDITFPGNSGATTVVYKVVLTEIAADSFLFNSGNSPKTITLNQYAEGSITFNLSKTDVTNITLPTNTTVLTGRPNANPTDDDDYVDPVISWVITGANSKKWRPAVTPTASHITGASVSGDIATLTNGGKIEPDLDIAINNTLGANNTATITGTYLVSLLGTTADTATLNLDNVLQLNTAPVAANKTFNGTEDVTLSIDLKANSGATDADTVGGADTLTYAIVADNTGGNGSLTLNTTTGVATFVPTANWNGTTNFTWKCNDGFEDSNTATATITLAAAPDAPTNITLSANTQPEDTAINTTIGSFSSTDVDGSGTYTYTLVETSGTHPDGAKFNISGNNLRNSVVFDYENPVDANTNNEYVIKVRSTDADGSGYTEKEFTITVTFVAHERWEISTYNADGSGPNGVHHVSAEKICDGGGFVNMPSGCFQLNHWVRWRTASGGCSSTEYGRGKITDMSSISDGTPTAYISGDVHFSSLADSEPDSGVSGTNC